ncbi:MAG: hypothetical protein WA863_09345 [Methyloceanibacter sp.]
MTTIYISDSGDDKNDGLSLQTAIYSLKRAKELHGGRNDCSPTIHASKIANEQNHLRHRSLGHIVVYEQDCLHHTALAVLVSADHRGADPGFARVEVVSDDLRVACVSACSGANAQAASPL